MKLQCNSDSIHVNLELKSRYTVITGENGSGKTVVYDVLRSCLGKGRIRSDCGDVYGNRYVFINAVSEINVEFLKGLRNWVVVIDNCEMVLRQYPKLLEIMGTSGINTWVLLGQIVYEMLGPGRPAWDFKQLKWDCGDGHAIVRLADWSPSNDSEVKEEYVKAFRVRLVSACERVTAESAVLKLSSAAKEFIDCISSVPVEVLSYIIRKVDGSEYVADQIASKFTGERVPLDRMSSGCYTILKVVSGFKNVDLTTLDSINLEWCLESLEKSGNSGVYSGMLSLRYKELGYPEIHEVDAEGIYINGHKTHSWLEVLDNIRYAALGTEEEIIYALSEGRSISSKRFRESVPLKSGSLAGPADRTSSFDRMAGLSTGEEVPCIGLDWRSLIMPVHVELQPGIYRLQSKCGDCCDILWADILSLGSKNAAVWSYGLEILDLDIHDVVIPGKQQLVYLAQFDKYADWYRGWIKEFAKTGIVLTDSDEGLLWEMKSCVLEERNLELYIHQDNLDS